VRAVSRILDGIDSPAQLKGLSLSKLKQLASELREELITTVTNTGGHLASNLGVVELTIALHRVFDSPKDKLIWDVGHQSYVHKLLTGRRHRFCTLRQYGGLSGFPEPAESPHDAFVTGHASTSISAALGMATARDLAAEDFHIVAIIGDGAISGGLALEGLNQAGHLRSRLIVVLNDNAMSISPSVGGLSRSLSRLRLNPQYRRAKRKTGGLLHRLHVDFLAQGWWNRLKRGLKGLIMPTTMWEEFGFRYIGPVDGHNIPELEKALTKAKNLTSKPIFLHVLTVKGKGYAPAENDMVHFHGIPPLVAKGNRAPSYSEVLGHTLLRVLREEPKAVAITAAMLEGTGLDAVCREFPGRVFDVGICEQHAVTFAAGLASRGFIPIVAIYSTFLQRAYDQVIHDVCLQNLPVIFAVDRGGIVGEDGKTHHGMLDLSYLSAIPNIIVAAASDENELQHLLYTAVRAGRPMAIRYPRGEGLGIPLDERLRQLPIGKGEVLRQGSDVAILSLGSIVAPSLKAAELLAERGISCAVVNARFVKPLDAALILSMAKEVKRLVTVEENVLRGGLGEGILSLLQGYGIRDVPVVSIGLPEEFIEHGPRGLLLSKLGLDGEGIAQHILSSFPELALHLMEPKG
jgi:1-deoxy-D-xylulose-5-phosphate synthase